MRERQLYNFTAAMALALSLCGCPGGTPGDGWKRNDSGGTTPPNDIAEVSEPDPGTPAGDPGTEEDTAPAPDAVSDAAPDVDEGALRVDSVKPGTGKSKGGDVVTVVGAGFIEGGMLVMFGSSLGFDVFVVSETRLSVTTPPGNPGLVDVTVIDDLAKTSATLAYGFRYEADVMVIGVEPAAGNVAGGEPVTISGSGFSQGSPKVLFGDRKAIGVQVVDEYSIHATTPAGVAPGPVDVHVTNDQGTAVSKGGYLYYETPRVVTVTPAVGPTGGGTEVALNGAGFEPGSKVRFGEAEASKLTYVSASKLLAVTPGGGPGAVDVTVETQYGYGGLPKGFHYLAGVPSGGVLVVAVQPGAGSTEGGDTVNVTAYGLTDAIDTKVTFGASAAKVLAVDAPLLTVTVETPPGPEGPAEVAVQSSEGSDTLEGGYTYETALKVLTVNPLSGPAAGGTLVSVYGQGFTAGALVRVGALPCSGILFKNAKTIECTTPPGSPGGADVTVVQQGESSTLLDGYFYESGSVELFVVDPDKGSQAGGTFVRLLGAGFEKPASVTFGGTAATHVTLVSSTLVTCKTPPGPIGPVDVAVTAAGATAKLAESFTYFDPVALYGGTWGPSVDGAVNVTVLDGGTGAPLPDAFTMLHVDPDTPYQGFTNSMGQITFSGPDVMGVQMVSASKEGYASNSVIEFDATNITIYLIPQPTPSMGPPPPGASISGKVHGLGKYVVAPPGNCNSMAKVNGQCEPCETDADCTEATQFCTLIGDTGRFCTKSCTSDLACDQGYACLSVGKPKPQCIPAPGKKQARCYTTYPSMFSQLPADEAPYIVKEDSTYNIPSRLGEVAVVCLGGTVAWTDETLFTAYAFGVQRHINVAAGANPGYDVTLNHPLTRTVKIRLDKPPFDSMIGPNFIAGLTYWDFGSDGVFFHQTFQDVLYGTSTDVLRVERQPQSFTGDVYDVTFTVLGLAITFMDDPTSQIPASYTLLTNLKDIESDTVFELHAGKWEKVETGLTRSVYDLHGFSEGDVWGVGPGGTIVHQTGLGWALQSSPTSADLHGIWGPAPNDMWAVGAKGTVLHFDGVKWSKAAVTGVSDSTTFRAVFGTSATNVYAAAEFYQGVWRYDGTAWAPLAGVPGADFRDIHGAGPDSIWAVGGYGAIRYWNGTSWLSQTSGSAKDLFSVFAVSKSEAYAVGADGQIIGWNGSGWSTMPSPTTRTLRAVWAAGPLDVYAVGDASTLLHYDGIEWAEQTIPSKTSYTALLSLWGNPATGKGFALGSSEVLMGPMLQVPEQQDPPDGGTMTDYFVSFAVKPGVPAHFNVVSVAIPSMFGPIPVWDITTDGDVFQFDLPDFANIEGTPGIPPGFYQLTIIRAYKENFDIDNYDLSDMATISWRSWAVDATFFNK